ncbi:YggS family pyridoxal phosphate-dependent enzyme [Sporosarcina pasteurii]|uniref:Pyridoxal phosphate homeostasis protein n=1 Tax=Sporosarcina pasteurii TaxID=1474 RepID=A0A380BHI7_SPOPA|nr:YggS family pyridoxal phosphate-dependent enzyme [Sporosarcina pasteurii]MDS9470508.1 YggS family pyridoxal phosphate-dependent enzyme [Sporosarcina pasteurii]QBQ05796.1 YggS family pyridoxal phosphate-dependent enzyme [Sporosarcina pasteurii]SUJ00537.1 Predicted enzyme with a TIM-barrel fold [Sporosarcina pasteurii]
MNKLQQRIQQIEKNIQTSCDKVGRNRSDVHVVAVTKGVSSTRAKQVIDSGFKHLGENRPDGLTQKLEQVSDNVNWHFIGNLQSRRVRDIIDKVSHIHSLSRMSIAKEIQKRATEQVDCFIQVNVSGEESKSGLTPDELTSFIEELAEYDKIRVVGLMTMAPNTEDEEEIRAIFKKMRELRNQIQTLNLAHAPCTELSMGMSNDYMIAIEEGATYVRIGTALVGEESEGD